MLVRTDSAGATHEFVDGCRDRGVRFSIGLPVDQRVRDSLLLAQEEDWIAAVESDGSERDGAWVTELTDLIDFDRWPEHTRVIARRERPHPGAQLSLFDTAEGFRHQIFITDQPDRDIAKLELRHRHRAHIENRIRAAKDTGLRNLPCADVVCNDAWLQLVLIAQDLTGHCCVGRKQDNSSTPDRRDSVYESVRAAHLGRSESPISDSTRDRKAPRPLNATVPPPPMQQTPLP